VTPTDDFSTAAPALASVGSRAVDTTYRNTTYHVARVPVPGTSWHLVSAVPRREMLATVGSMEWLLVLTSSVLAFAVLMLVQRLLRDRDTFRTASRTDGLTALANRSQAERALTAAAESSLRTGESFAVAFIDIDHFKQINDGFGHDVGDRVLQRLGALLGAHSRRGDVVARWGGEEFLVVMPEMDVMAAARAAQRLVDTVRATPIEGRPVTISVGVAAGSGLRSASLVQAADEALYRAKASGRDRVEVAPSFDDADLEAVVLG
jgi:diguanylate cyclase (GGDEF)-like protein